MKIALDDKAVRHLIELLDYVEHDEWKDYDEENPPSNHIYTHIRALSELLQSAGIRNSDIRITVGQESA
jgi:hypothetical protein